MAGLVVSSKIILNLVNEAGYVAKKTALNDVDSLETHLIHLWRIQHLRKHLQQEIKIWGLLCDQNFLPIILNLIKLWQKDLGQTEKLIHEWWPFFFFLKWNVQVVLDDRRVNLAKSSAEEVSFGNVNIIIWKRTKGIFLFESCLYKPKKAYKLLRFKSIKVCHMLD